MTDQPSPSSPTETRGLLSLEYLEPDAGYHILEELPNMPVKFIPLFTLLNDTSKEETEDAVAFFQIPSSPPLGTRHPTGQGS